MASAWSNFKNIFSRPLFTIIFRPEMLKFHPYSILTGDTRVEFVIYRVLSLSNGPNQQIKPQPTRWHYPLITYFRILRRVLINVSSFFFVWSSIESDISVLEFIYIWFSDFWFRIYIFFWFDLIWFRFSSHRFIWLRTELIFLSI